MAAVAQRAGFSGFRVFRRWLSWRAFWDVWQMGGLQWLMRLAFGLIEAVEGGLLEGLGSKGFIGLGWRLSGFMGLGYSGLLAGQMLFIMAGGLLAVLLISVGELMF